MHRPLPLDARRHSTQRFLRMLGGLFLLICVIYLVSARVLLSGFEQVETKEALQNAERLERALSSELDRLDALNLTWAQWDQAWNYVSQKQPEFNREFEASDLSESGLAQLESNIIVFLNRQGKVVFGRSYDLVKHKASPLQNAVAKELRRGGQLQELNLQQKTGFYALPGGTVMIAARPVLRSNGQGPATGTLILGRYIDAQVQQRLTEQLQLPVQLMPQSAALPPDFAQARQVFLSGEKLPRGGDEPAYVRRDSGSTLSVYLLLRDGKKAPVFFARLAMPRDSYGQGRSSLQLLLLSLLIIGGIASVVLYFLQRALLNSHMKNTENEELYRLLARNSSDVLYVVELAERRLTCFGDLSDVVGGQEMTWQAWEEMAHADDRALRGVALEKAFADGRPYRMEYRVRGHDGAYRHWLDRGRPLRDSEGRCVRFVGSCTDITERKKSELEKEVLLKEIHHRVKNNMQVISSMLNLQAAHVKDRATLEMFRDSQNRIKSMALIHERLYQQHDLSAVDFAEYLRQLVANLMRSYRTGVVELEMDFESVALDIDHAVPCGLIVNELVTNALKYAFAGRPHGTLKVTLHGGERGSVWLGVQDDGIGFPADVNIYETESLGLQLVTALSEQIGGQLDLRRSPGTTWTLRFSAQGARHFEDAKSEPAPAV